MSKDAKVIRGQVRQVVKEVLPSILESEAFNALYSKLAKELQEKLEIIQYNVTESLKTMDGRSKDVQQFIMNQVQAEMAKNAPKAPSQGDHIYKLSEY